MHPTPTRRATIRTDQARGSLTLAIAAALLLLAPAPTDAQAKAAAPVPANVAAPSPPAAAKTTAAPAVVDPGEVPGLGRPPFQAWIKVGAYWPRRTIGRNALAAGVWRKGDVIRVIDCTPRCDAPRALGLVEGGAVVPLRYLAKLPMPVELARAVVASDHLVIGHGRGFWRRDTSCKWSFSSGVRLWNPA